MSTFYLPIELEHENFCNGCDFLDITPLHLYRHPTDWVCTRCPLKDPKSDLDQKTLRRPEWCPLIKI
jgi:hypothetical protein